MPPAPEVPGELTWWLFGDKKLWKWSEIPSGFLQHLPNPRKISLIMEWHSNRTACSQGPRTQKSLSFCALPAILQPPFMCSAHTPLSRGGFWSGGFWFPVRFFVSRWVLAAFTWVAASAVTQSSHCFGASLHVTEQKFKISSAFLGGSLQFVAEDSSNFSYFFFFFFFSLRKATQTKECSLKEFRELN